MPKHTVAPVASVDRDDTVHDHPAFGQISLHRISGTRVLYDSDFKHRDFVRIEVRHSQLRRGLSRDWHFARDSVVCVDLSEAQWATFVSSFNIGGGVPCTIDSIGKEEMPDFPMRDAGQEFKGEASKKLKDSVKAIDDAIAAIEANTNGLSKKKVEAMTAGLRSARRDLVSNLPFVADQFGEYMESRVEKAKVEVNAYMTSTIQRAGLETLGAGPLLLEDES